MARRSLGHSLFSVVVVSTAATLTVLTIGSYCVPGRGIGFTVNGYLTVGMRDGIIFFGCYSSPSDEIDADVLRWNSEVVPSSQYSTWPSFSVNSTRIAGCIHVWWIGLPIMVLGILVFRPRRCRHPLEVCQDCGYDLTGNVSGRCPECGTAVGCPRRDE